MIMSLWTIDICFVSFFRESQSSFKSPTKIPFSFKIDDVDDPIGSTDELTFFEL